MPSECPTMPLDTHSRMLRREAQGLPLQAFEVAEHKRPNLIAYRVMSWSAVVALCAITWTLIAAIVT